MQHIHAELDAVVAPGEVGRIEDLPLALVRVGGAVGVVRRAQIDAAGRLRQVDLRHIAGRGPGPFEVGVGICGEGLLGLVVQLAPVLVAQLIADAGGYLALQLGHAVVQLHKVVAEGVLGVGYRRLRLHTAGGVPAQPVEQERHALLGVDLVVELRRIDLLEADARRHSEVARDVRQSGGVVRRAGRVRDVLARSQCTGLLVDGAAGRCCRRGHRGTGVDQAGVGAARTRITGARGQRRIRQGEECGGVLGLAHAREDA